VGAVDGKTFKFIDGVKVDIRSGSLDTREAVKYLPILRTEVTGSAHENQGTFKFLNL